MAFAPVFQRPLAATFDRRAAAAAGNGLLFNLVAYWTLNEASGTRNDSVGSSHLLESGTVSSVAGILGNAAFSNNSVPRLVCASNSTLQCGNIDFSLTAWCKFTNVASGPLVVGKDGGSALGDYRIDVASSKFRAIVFTASGVAAIVSANTFGAITTGVWYFVACLFDAAAGTISLSVNAGVADSAAKTGTPVAGTQRLAVIMESGMSTPNHAVDEIGLWKRLLTPTDLSTLYNGGAGLAYAQFTT